MSQGKTVAHKNIQEDPNLYLSLISGKEKHFNNSNNKNQTVNKAASMISEVRILQKSNVQ